jgi:hypothetical protein
MVSNVIMFILGLMKVCSVAQKLLGDNRCIGRHMEVMIT